MNTAYHDELIEINENEIVFPSYYFPFAGEKRVPLNEIARIETRAPTLWNGKWRIWGGSRFNIWFPFDGARPGRDMIFIATLHHSRVRIGFTVEHSLEVINVLQSRGVRIESTLAP